MERVRVGVYVMTIVTTMRDLEYKQKTIRMSEETWIKLKEKRKKSKLSWNLFLVKLLSTK